MSPIKTSITRCQQGYRWRVLDGWQQIAAGITRVKRDARHAAALCRREYYKPRSSHA